MFLSFGTREREEDDEMEVQCIHALGDFGEKAREPLRAASRSYARRVTLGILGTQEKD